MKPSIVLLVTLCACPVIRAERPSENEIQYLSSVLPLIQAHDLRTAEEKLNQGLKTFSKSALLSNALGIVYEQQGRKNEAISAFEQAIEWLPGFTAAQIHLGTLYAGMGECGRAKTLFTSAIATISDAGALSAAGLGLAQCQDYAAAASALEKAHSLGPPSAATTFNLALARYHNGEFDAALAALDALPPGPEQQRPEVLYLRGKLIAALHRSGAAPLISQACLARPEESYCNDAAVELIRQDQVSEAAGLIEATIKAMPAPPVTLLTTLGLAQFRLGRYQQAIETYSQAIQVDPQLDAPREGLGFLLYITGDLEKGRAVVEQGLARQGADFYLSYLRALILQRSSGAGKPEVIEAAERAIQANPAFAPSYFLRGKIRLEEGNASAALSDFQTAARLDPKYPLPHYKIAQILLRQGRREEAEQARRRFAALGSLREEELLARQAQALLLQAAH